MTQRNVRRMATLVCGAAFQISIVACGTIPDLEPYAQSTAALHSAVSSSHDLLYVAHEAIKDLGKADINEAITGIENRTVELIRLTKSVQSIAEDAEDVASSLRLEKARRVVDSSTNVVNAIKELRTELDSTGRDKKLETLASTSIKAVQDLRATIELS